VSPALLVAIEMILVLAVVGFGVWQLWSVRREIERDRRAAAERKRDDADGAPPAAGP
jgi:hypothetical protein